MKRATLSLILVHSSVTALLPVAHAREATVGFKTPPVYSSLRETLTMQTNFEGPDVIITHKYQPSDSAAAQWARDTWGPDARMRALKLDKAQFDTTLNFSDWRLERVQISSKDVGSVSVREYRGLDASYTKDNQVSDKSVGRAPDATVIIPKGFDPNKPVKVVIFNHGLYGSGQDWAKNARLAEQMASADANTIMAIPEWQSNPTRSGGPNAESSKIYQRDFFRNQLQEIFNSTPQLKGKKVDDIESLSIIAHSAGGRAAMAQLNDNGLGQKVTGVTVLDSMYTPNAYDSWIRDNAKHLASGRKHLTVFYQNDNPRGDSRTRRMVMETDVKRALGQYQVPEGAYDRNTTNVKDPSVLNRGGVVFIYDCDHMNLPKNHVGRILAAEQRRATGVR